MGRFWNEPAAYEIPLSIRTSADAKISRCPTRRMCHLNQKECNLTQHKMQIRNKDLTIRTRLGALDSANRVLHVLTAVDVDLGAVHVGRRIGAQHVDDLGNLVGGAKPMQRDMLHQCLGAG